MSTVSPWIGREQTFEALGQTWKLARWERAVWKEFLDWARDVVPDPVEQISRHIDKLPERLQDLAIEKAIAASRVYLSVGSPEVQSLLKSLEGTVRVLYLLLKVHQPKVTEDDAYRIAMSLGKGDMQRRLDAALGENPNAEAPGSEKPTGDQQLQ